jgi:hypothetical protein
MQCYLYKIERNEKRLHLLSPLAEKDVPQTGLPTLAVIGSLREPLLGVQHSNIAYNPDFLVLLHELVRDTMIDDADVQHQASQQANGFVFIVDRRAPEGNDIPKQAIIGIFLVNENKTGLLPISVEEKLMQRLREII